MKESFRDIPFLDASWDFWFAHTKNLRKKNKQKKESYYFILNSKTSEVEYTSNSITDVLGYHPSEFTIEKIFSCIHPDDLAYCRDCEYASLQTSNKLYFNEQHRFNYQYTYRVKTKEDIYITILQSYSTIEVDDDGHILKTLVLHEKIQDYETRPDDDFRIFDKSKNKSVTNFKKYNLSEREWEVLGLIHDGYKSAEIADMLFLSKTTIDTHRKNILRKTKSKTAIELLNKISL